LKSKKRNHKTAAFCLSFNLNAQETKANRKANVAKTEKIADKTERMEERASKLADKVEMNADQKERFIQAYVEYKKAIKATRRTKVGKTVKKAQVKEIKTAYKEDLSTFLSEDQMIALEEIAKEKRMMKKEKKGAFKKHHYKNRKVDAPE